MKMYYVYVLRGESGRLYIGWTSNLERRLQEHKTKKVWTTRRLGKFELIFYEAFKLKKDAIRREKYLKTSKGKRGLKLILREAIRI